MNVKDAIKRNFSRYAACYDDYSSVQDRAGPELISGLGQHHFRKILDIGCGTGNYTLLLRNRFDSAAIKAVDISGRMIEIAQRKLQDKKIEFLTSDAETADFDDKFDLITSNACFQWFSNLDKALAKYKNMLTQDGTLLFSVFGPLTFRELGESLELLYKKDVSISSGCFPNAEKLAAILEKNFHQVSIKNKISKESYTCLWELLKAIKYTGTRGLGLNVKGISKGRIGKLERIYKERFKDITATYQVFYCRAKRRD